MTTQVDDRPIQKLLSPLEGDEPSSPGSFRNRVNSPRPGRIWMVAIAGVAALVVGAALVGTGAQADNAPAVANRPEESSVVLPAHLQEFEERTKARASEGGVLPAHLQEFEARTKAQESEADASSAPAYLIIQREIDKALGGANTQAADEQQHSAHQIIQDEIDAALADLDPRNGRS